MLSEPLSLDQRNCSSNIHTTFGKEALDLRFVTNFVLVLAQPLW